MISLDGVNDALYVFESAGLSEPKLGQASTWLDVIGDYAPLFEDEHIVRAAKAITKRRIETRRTRYVTPGDLIAELMNTHLFK